MIGSPILIAGLVIGLVVGMLQAMTQVHDQTVAFVPKLLGLCLVIALTLPWLSSRMKDYTEELLEKPVTSLESMTSPITGEELSLDSEPDEIATTGSAQEFSMPVVRTSSSFSSSMPVMTGGSGSMPVAGQTPSHGVRTADATRQAPVSGETTR